jgi:carbon-monoxide dehydrogenase small subunit
MIYHISILVNGQEYQRDIEPRLLLSDFLRHELGLTGTHVGCEHGVCGACTILFDGEPVRSCLMFAVQANAHEIGTVEGLATSRGRAVASRPMPRIRSCQSDLRFRISRCR